MDVKAHYAESGTQVMAINTLFQLYAMKKEDNAQLKVADKLLFMPDLFSYYLTGVANNEYSIASTSELLDAKARTWNFKLIRELGLPEHLSAKWLCRELPAAFETGNQGTDRNRLRGRSDCCSFARYGQCG